MGVCQQAQNSNSGRGREAPGDRRAGFCCVSVQKSLGDPAAGERAEGEDIAGCVDVLGKALHLCFHAVSLCGGKQQADEVGCLQGVRVETCRTNPRVAPLGVKTTPWFGTGVSGAGSKLPTACGERQLVNEGLTWSKGLKMLLQPPTLARGEGPDR